ncbi:MAG: hypothetical protein N3C63_01460 [Rhodocyclaceae bacterium]|nr:hypothetical protein [Rhodocyclaceae bacterium]
MALLGLWVRKRAGSIPAAFLQALPGERASLARQTLQAALRAPSALPLENFIDAARKAGWPKREIEKLAAYGELALGQGAQAYARVCCGHLAEDDAELAIAILAEAYRAQRYDEGRALLATLDPARLASHPDAPLFFTYAIQHTLAASGDLAAAIKVYEEAKRFIAAEKLFVVAYPLCFEAGWLEEADRLNRALPPAERQAEEHFAAGCVELARDYYPEGFRLYEARYEMIEGRLSGLALPAGKRWLSEPLAGRHLLLQAEQGLGDIVMMARYLPEIIALGGTVSVAVPAAAQRLLEANFPSCRFVTSAETESFDFWLGLMSLPHRLRTTVRHVPARSGYLQVPTEQRRYWAQRCNETGRPDTLRVGLAWSGFPGHRADRRRSVPFDLMAALIDRWPQVDFYSLQTAPAPRHIPNLIEFGEELLTLADTAALIAEMDYVVSVDTSAIHLAGALGKSARLLLPYRYEWRWGLVGEANAWYDSVRVLRQIKPGQWAEPLAQLEAELASWAGAKAC